MSSGCDLKSSGLYGPLQKPPVGHGARKLVRLARLQTAVNSETRSKEGIFGDRCSFGRFSRGAADGLSNKAIVLELGLFEGTVKAQRRSWPSRTHIETVLFLPSTEPVSGALNSGWRPSSRDERRVKRRLGAMARDGVAQEACKILAVRMAPHHCHVIAGRLNDFQSLAEQIAPAEGCDRH